MSTPHFGDTARDPQDAAKESREQRDCDRAPITAEQAADYFDGKPINMGEILASPADWMLPFCSTDENRIFLSKPFNQGDYTWGLDGRIMVRTPLISNVENNPDFKYPNALKCWKIYNVSGAQLESPPDLPEDAGKTIRCPKCSDGQIYCRHCDNWSDCNACYGVNEVLDPRWMRLGGHPFKLHYLAKIKRVAGVKLAVFPPSSKSSFGFLYFKSDNLEGILAGMTLEPGQDADNEWKPEPAAADSKEAA